jgi:hypothetical protein
MNWRQRRQFNRQCAETARYLHSKEFAAAMQQATHSALPLQPISPAQQEQNRLRALAELEEIKQAHARCIHCPEPAMTHDALGLGYCGKHLVEAVRRGAYHAQPQTPTEWLYANSAWLWIIGSLLIGLFFALVH